MTTISIYDLFVLLVISRHNMRESVQLKIILVRLDTGNKKLCLLQRRQQEEVRGGISFDRGSPHTSTGRTYNRLDEMPRVWDQI